MVTPNLLCGNYSYQIINTTNKNIVKNGSLGTMNLNTYYFNFTQPKGEYLVVLCDNSTRQVRVTSEDDGKMIIAAIIILPMLLAFLLLIGAATMSEEHNVLRIILFLFSFPLFWASMNFGLKSVVEFYDFPILQGAIGTTVYWIAILFMVLILYLVAYLIIKASHAIMQKKNERIEY